MTDELLELARRFADECPPELGREIAVTGSVGAGLADGYSDIELLHLVEERPAVDAVTRWLESLGATDVLAGEAETGVWAWCRFGDAEVEPFWGELAGL